MAASAKDDIIVEDSTEEQEETELNFKVILIGETGVGKTCIMLRASRDEFKEEHTVTLGADFTNYYLKINKRQAKLQMWDTCGLEMYKSMIRVFFKGSHAAFLVFDVNNEKTFSTLPFWLKELREFTSPDLLCYLIGNKIDLPNRAVTKADADTFVSKYQLSGYYETSAKSGIGIKTLIHIMAKELFRKMGHAASSKDSNTHILGDNQAGQKSGGCKC